MALTLGNSAPVNLALRWHLAVSAVAQPSKPSGWLAGWDLSASQNGADLGKLSASQPGAEDLSASYNGADCGKLSASQPGAEVALGRFGLGPAQQAFWMAVLGPQRQVHWR
uniref:Uncharacterized protein n=1 Tax=Oryza sativa subsp. japonica TaxID=39947 RepID=Q6ZA51_ORYSJ|nr:hypothetical protein [Oryza sativa Japonica Group]